jgi:hypothetical protein
LSPQWAKSSFSGPKGECVECRIDDRAVVAVRDTQNRELGLIAFSTEAWTAFVADLDEF